MAKVKQQPTLDSISKKHLDMIRAAIFVRQEKVYEKAGLIALVLQGDYTVESELVKPRNGSASWTAHKAVVTYKGEKLPIVYRSGVDPDSDGDLIIMLFRANRDFVCSNGTVIKKGSEKIFAINAA